MLNQEYAEIDWNMMKLDTSLKSILVQRTKEINQTLNAQVPLATIFLCGSSLEGLLLHVASENSQRFNLATNAPKLKNGKVKYLQQWTLSELIDVAHEEKLISLDVKKFSHSLRQFRNYIHPRQQAVEQFDPTMHTAKISWQVL